MSSTRELSNQELIDYIEMQMENSCKSYFDTILNFIKWNTALAIAAILWFGNYIINVTTILNQFQWTAAISCLLLFFFTIVYSIAIFYMVSEYHNQLWILRSQWLESVKESRPPQTEESQKRQNAVIGKLREYYQNSPKIAKSFDIHLSLQMLMLCLGLIVFIAFIISMKPWPV